MNDQLRLHGSEILLDLTARDLKELVGEAVAHLSTLGRITAEQRHAVQDIIDRDALDSPWDLGSSVGVLRIFHAGDAPKPIVVLARVPDGVKASDHERIHFLWITIAPYGADVPDNQDLEPFGWMLHDEHFSASILGANDPAEVLAAYQTYLEYVQAPPDARRPSMAPRDPSDDPKEEHGFIKGLKADIARRAPHYVDDFVAGFHPKGLASILFLLFACLAPSVAFGGLLEYLTDGQIGVVEAIMATAIGGTVYALFSGQPLTLLGSTGPVTIFFGLLYGVCKEFGVPFLPGLFWVGMWTALIMVVFALTDAARYIQWFTRFTDEIFGALIALIFLVAALQNIFKGFGGPEPPNSGQLLSVIVALGTFVIALQLSRVRQKPLLLPAMREFLADFGPAIAILVMTGVAFSIPIAMEHLAVPDHFSTTTGRPWIVNPTDAPVWFWFGSIPLALLGSVLMYLDQNITVRLVNSPHHHLTKGEGYSLDMLVIGVLIAVCAVFGLPWVVAATVRSLNHVRSLAKTQYHPDGSEHIISVRENRLTGFTVHLLIGCSLLALGLLKEIPMAVLFGLFLYMGIASMRGNQFVDRLKLWVTDPSLYPPTHYMRRVPRRAVHAFTAIQAMCLAMLWIVKTSKLGVIFPLFIAILVPIRRLMNRFFDATDLAFLDADEVPEEEQFRDID